MTKNELNRFREILTATIADLERLARKRDGITIERSADLLEEVQAASERALTQRSSRAASYCLTGSQAPRRARLEGRHRHWDTADAGQPCGDPGSLLDHHRRSRGAADIR